MTEMEIGPIIHGLSCTGNTCDGLIEPVPIHPRARKNIHNV